jgi:PAS domain S-box-containing protein
LLGDSGSLLTFLEAAVLVSDPDGRGVYANPAFERCFEVSSAEISGQSLTNIFEGGAREAVLNAVARACTEIGRVRFFVRHGQVGYSATASPIESGGQRVGVLLLFDEETASKERMLNLHRRLGSVAGELTDCLEELRKKEGRYGAGQGSGVSERSGRALGRLRTLCDDLITIVEGAESGEISGRSLSDPENMVREVVATLSEDAVFARIHLEVEASAGLPSVPGDADALCAGLVDFLLDRFANLPPKAWLTLAVREVRGPHQEVILQFSIAEEYSQEMLPEDDDRLPLAISDVIRTLGGQIRIVANPLGGRTTLLLIPVG